MRVKIVVTDEQGQVYDGEVELVRRSAQQAVRRTVAAPPKPSPMPVLGKVDFALPLRPFVKKYARELSGPKKFTLLVAHTAKGQAEAEVELKEVEKNWNRMTSLLSGKFNRFYSQTARDNGWVDSSKPGKYKLRSNWKDILN